MSVGIHPIKLGVGCCYLLREKGTILIDCGSPNQARTFVESLENLSIKPQEIHQRTSIRRTENHFRPMQFEEPCCETRVRPESM